jgi:hypothetical protein
MRRLTRTTVAAASIALTVPLWATPAAAAPAAGSAALAAPTCSTLRSTSSFQGRCRSWNPSVRYQALGWCSNGIISFGRSGDPKRVGFANTWGAWSGFDCGPGYTVSHTELYVF